MRRGAGAPLDRLVDALAMVAGALLCALVVLTCVDVAARTFKLFATPWTLDIAEYMLYAITFLGAPWVLREDGHIAIEIFVEQLTPRARRAVRRGSDALGALICAVLLYYTGRVFWRSYSANNLVYETFVFPEWYLYSIAPPVFLLLLLLLARRALRPLELEAREPPREGV
ncbi:MAG: TRAP transporter small permease [Betaproteobacteria bacterium]|nr:TRAP transporter small permease [Betaproteobacteria bacterium]